MHVKTQKSESVAEDIFQASSETSAECQSEKTAGDDPEDLPWASGREDEASNTWQTGKDGRHSVL